MPAEVLVMCPACGRPQPAGGARCIACGAPLPDAPVPHESGPFLSVELGGGRSLVGEGGQLTYRVSPSAPAQVMELGRLRELALESRAFREALLLLAFIVPGVLAHTPAPRFLSFGMAVLGVVLAATCRVHALVLETSTGGRLRWSLGLARRGSARDEALLAAWGTLVSAVRARGVVVRDATGAVLASPEPPPGPASDDGPRA
ncbi:zinc ribbon domain-containing protein [Myxococcus stipitatus]|uniref:zinc ribbon domain-containing protein n=1 Tax=Myxococcus stipitatus TaxID=83455 RepID=UPI001F2F7F0D|nr:zinc ribbon domain-containing protein [Myxococcus stipitatus]MCE9672948.1 zinc ribbon domain-containing protein [Myxococcus stipitatus]